MIRYCLPSPLTGLLGGLIALMAIRAMSIHAGHAAGLGFFLVMALFLAIWMGLRLALLGSARLLGHPLAEVLRRVAGGNDLSLVIVRVQDLLAAGLTMATLTEGQVTRGVDGFLIAIALWICGGMALAAVERLMELVKSPGR